MKSSWSWREVYFELLYFQAPLKLLKIFPKHIVDMIFSLIIFNYVISSHYPNDRNIEKIKSSYVLTLTYILEMFA